MKIKVVKRFGTNSDGADPNWIIETRLINKSASIPSGFEVITSTVLKQELEAQVIPYQTWLDAQPIPARNLNSISERLALNVTNNVDIAYRMYKYISNDQASFVYDVTLPPWGLDYTINTIPKFKAVRTFDKGFLINVVWHAWDFDNNQSIEEVLKVDIEYTQVDDAVMQSAKSVVSRTTTRQWIKEDGNYDATLVDVKVTPKIYDTTLERNDEGNRRRHNIFIELTEKYVTLVAVLVTSGDIEAAQIIGKNFLSQISTEVTDFQSIGSDAIIDKLDSLAIDTAGSDDYILNTTVPDIPQTQGTVPNAIGLTVKAYLQEKFKGEI